MVDDIRRNAIEFGNILYVQRKGVGGVKEVFAELLAVGRVLLAEGFEASLRFGGKFRTRKTEVTDFTLDDALTSFTQGCKAC